MKYNIEQINKISKLLAKVVEDALKTEGKAEVLIGSGVIESGCKQIVAQRLKLPGAQWNLDGAIATAKAPLPG